MEQADFRGLLSTVERPTTGAITLARPGPERAKGSAHSPFPGRADNGNRVWVKAAGQGDLDRALTTEFVIMKVGALIGACVVDNYTINITEDHAGWQFREGDASKVLVPGIGHAVAEVPNATETRGQPHHRESDDNRRRHVGVYALYDLAFGEDPQWLHDTEDDLRCYEVDHGWYLPPGGPNWTIDDMTASVDVPHPMPHDPSGLDGAAVDEIATALETLNRESLVSVVSAVPQNWASDDELEILTWFLARRAKPTADRLRSLKGGA